MLALLLLLAACAQGAVLQGVVLDDETGSPLARARVSLVPLPGTPAATTPVVTAARGNFLILNVAPGWYVLRATRRGYAPGESGQLHVGRPGHAFEVSDGREAGFIEIHMGHLPAITGAVVDENGIGIPKWTVHIYSAHKPVRHLAQTVTDDRGIYRLGELEPGQYFVRTSPGALEDQTSLLATYFPSAVELADARAVVVRVGETARDVNLRPVRGKGFTLSGVFLPLEGRATLTLITDTGRIDVASGNRSLPVSFSTGNVQPGPVELIVIGTDGLGKPCGSYARLLADKDISTLRPACTMIGQQSVQLSGPRPSSPPVVRRADLDGATPDHPLARDEVLLPGHWEIAVPPGNYFVQSVRTSGPPLPNVAGWFGFDAGSYMRLSVTLSPSYSTIAGVVSAQGSPVAGAPLFLTNTDTGQTWNARSNQQGSYSIGGLGPGAYTIISGFDLDLLDPLVMKKARDVRVDFGATATQPLELILP